MTKKDVKKKTDTSKKYSKSSSIKPKAKRNPQQRKAKLSDKRRKKKQTKKLKKRLVNKLVELGLTLAICILLLILMNLFVFSISKFEGYSMVPTLSDQDRLFVSKLSKIKRFDLVYIKDGNNEVSVRRIIGLPNEQVAYRDDELYINNELKAERFLSKRIREESEEPITENFDLYDLFQKDMVPPNKYFVLGDNREYATDSREYGFVDEKAIIGIVKAKVFPFYDMRQF